jgi:hypothetical protein
MEPGLFGRAQAEYAAHGIATFPVEFVPDGSGDFKKKPAVRNWQQFGLQGSQELVQRFANATAIGFVTGRKNAITLIDVDSTDDRDLRLAIARHGETPIISRTRSGGHHLWYRYNGELRAVRPELDRPVDLLGDRGYAVLPPSLHPNGERYRFVVGSLDDLDRLSPCRDAPKKQAKAANDNFEPTARRRRMGEGDGRNEDLFRVAMRAAATAESLDDLVDRVRTINTEFAKPMTEGEVMGIVQSAWGYETSGTNRFGRKGGAWLYPDEIDTLVADPHLGMLVTWLRSENKPDAEFWIANGLDKKLGWPRRQLPEARQRALEAGWIVQVSKPAPGHPARYRWGPTALKHNTYWRRTA